ncbi:hypothetical protein [Streptomyces sp. NPDC002580]|uniref:hypothetical protein n=1 Tax=Streptomyces sp. NPDC002580 TaxID=3364653 RepID=UPI0036C8D949
MAAPDPVRGRTPNVDINAWGALHRTGTAHRYEQIAGSPYYEEPEVRAATFLCLALTLKPFADYNLVSRGLARG